MNGAQSNITSVKAVVRKKKSNKILCQTHLQIQIRKIFLKNWTLQNHKTTYGTIRTRQEKCKCTRPKYTSNNQKLNERQLNQQLGEKLPFDVMSIQCQILNITQQI